jgi:hypothetical protein
MVSSNGARGASGPRRYGVFGLALVAAIGAGACVRHVGETYMPFADGLCLEFDRQERRESPDNTATPHVLRMTVENGGGQLHVKRLLSCPPVDGYIPWERGKAVVHRRNGEVWTFDASGGTGSTTVTKPDGTTLLVTFAASPFRQATALGLLDDERVWFDVEPDAAAIVDLSTGKAWAYGLPRDRLKAIAPDQEMTRRGTEIDVAVEEVTAPEPGTR